LNVFSDAKWCDLLMFVDVICLSCVMRLQCPVDFSSPRQHYNPNNADPAIAGDYGGYTSEYFIGAYSSDAVWVIKCTTIILLFNVTICSLWN